MNAKKIMGAVLVALLAAALFVGAGAAADDVKMGTVFVYENTSVTGGVDLEDGVWTGANGAQVSVTNGVVYPGANFVAGDYKFNGTSVYVTYPTATYSVGAAINKIDYIALNGGNVYAGSNLTIAVTSASKNVKIDAVMNGATKIPYQTFINNAKAGKYSEEGKTYNFRAVFNSTNFVDGVPVDVLVDTVSALKYTVIGESDATISANVNTVYEGEYVTFTIKGTPGTNYILNTTGFKIYNDQYVAIPAYKDMGYNFTMPNIGQASFVAEVTDDEEATVTLYFLNKEGKEEKVDDAEIEIEVSAPVLTATVGADSYFIGENIVITGTSTNKVEKSSYDYYISGVNFKATELKIKEFDAGKTWKVTLITENVNETGSAKKLDVGTYTISMKDGDKTVKTVAVALKQPFISVLEAPEVVVQNTDAEFVINAEATTEGIQWYLFGTNYFTFGAVDSPDDAKKTPNQYTVKLAKKTTDNMSAGQYFMVFQHPMYDQEFQINASTNGDINLEAKPLFNVYDRQTANAAQALCDALDSQNFDDMYVKYSFFIVGQDESFSMSDLPTKVVKGDKIVISGVDTVNAEDGTVTVEMISTAFAAVPKETVGSAAFIVATTTIAEDGTWEITLDTTDLNVDEYSLSVAINAIPKKTVTVDVVAAEDKPEQPEQPTDKPEQPEQPEQPTEPETPGFGALAALAGLGAVAVLLLRRE